MKALIEENGDLLFEDEYKSGAWFGLIYLSVFFAVFVYINGIQNVPTYVYLIYLFFIGVCALLMHLNLRSNCRFIVHEKKFKFDIVSNGLITSGVISIKDIEKVVEEETRDGRESQKRYAVEYGEKTVPLYLQWKSKKEQEELGSLINSWLIEHSISHLVIRESA